MSIADVVGKGLPAALLMSNLQAAVRAFATAAAEPHDVCASVNRLLCRNIASGKFVTFCYAVVDTGARHGVVRQRRTLPARSSSTPTADVERLSTDRARAGRHRRTGRTRRGAGAHRARRDRLVCFTDGITEARAPDGDEFGDDRLVETIRANRTRSADDLARLAMEAVQAWTGGGFQDDATLIVVAAELTTRMMARCGALH